MKTAPRVLTAFALSVLLSPASHAADTARLAHDCTAPDYANAWVRGDLQGSVTIAYSTDASGQVVNPRVVQSSGYRQLDLASLKAIKMCRAAPAATAGAAALSGKVRYVWEIK